MVKAVRSSSPVVSFALVALTACSSADPSLLGEPSGGPAPPSAETPPEARTIDARATGAGAGAPANAIPKTPACAAVDGKILGDWSLFGDGQCLVGVQNFYPKKFGAKVPIARDAYTGACAPQGACHIWVDDIPDPNQWERIPNDGNSKPSTYDLVVYPPASGNPYGHIASVDRVQAGSVYVMDTNWSLNERKAAAPHTTGTYVPYGWYHLKSRPKTLYCSDVPLPPEIAHQPCANGDGKYCGGNSLRGNGDTLYQCTGGAVTVAELCTGECVHMPNGQDDVCP
jgi:hypothetical protein